MGLFGSAKSRQAARAARREYKLKKQENRLAARSERLDTRQEGRNDRVETRADSRENKVQMRQDTKLGKAEERFDAESIAYQNGVTPTDSDFTSGAKGVSSVFKSVAGIFGKGNEEFSEMPASNYIPSMSGQSSTMSTLFSSPLGLGLLGIGAYFLFKSFSKKRR